GGILVSQTISSGHCQQSYIELGPAGVPRPLRGERWCDEWRGDGDNMLACWLGFPDVIFSGGIYPNLRVAVEAFRRFGGGPWMLRPLSRISLTSTAGRLVPGPGEVVWMPDASPSPYPVR